jgi:capsule polysaccharide export protein KpsE/RkpR
MHDVSFESSRDGLIRITSKASTPQLAADIANTYVEALYSMNSQLAITEASQRRLFFQQQVDAERAQLSNAEDSLKAMQQKTGMIQLNGQTELLLRDIATVRSQITNREVQLRSLSTFDTPENPDIQQVQQELNALRSKLSQLENTQRSSLGNLSSISSAGEVPAAGLEYLRKFRDVQYNESLFALLSKQLEAARLDEAKSAPVLQVVDRAVPAERKAGPSRILIVLFSLVGGIVAGSLLILLRAVMPGFLRKLELS